MQLAHPATRPRRFATIDCEMSGPYNADRVVEFAVVVDVSTGNVTHEYDLLVNSSKARARGPQPSRDTRASMSPKALHVSVAAAPG
jgi:hypothetical protein